MFTNSEIINLALQKAGFSTRINPATPDMVQDGWRDLRLLIAELSITIPALSAAFNSSDIDAPSGFEDAWINAVMYELAKRMQPEYETVLGQDFLTAAKDSMDNLRCALLSVPELQRRSDMPVGAGWKQRVDQNFYHQEHDECR